MSDTQNKWVPVSERLPEDGRLGRLALCNGNPTIAYFLPVAGRWYRVPDDMPITNVTHWMDLPEPPEPPKPADPFGAFWEANKETMFWRTSTRHAAMQVWNAAKEHYAKPSDYMRGCEDASVAISSMVNRILEGKDDGNGRLNDTALEKVRRTLMERLKPQPDFETWWSSDGFSRVNPLGTLKERANGIWNAAQGKPEA